MIQIIELSSKDISFNREYFTQHILPLLLRILKSTTRDIMNFVVRRL